MHIGDSDWAKLVEKYEKVFSGEETESLKKMDDLDLSKITDHENKKQRLIDH